jgi:CRISPR-associated protein Csm4
MQTWKACLSPQSAFGTPPKGDTLFGQLCWAARNRFGKARLEELLVGYTQGRPYLVVSDALPAGHLPRPALPMSWFSDTGGDRKALKKRAWLPLDELHYSVARWLARCRPAEELAAGNVSTYPQPHNSINRATNTTGEGFDPYNSEQLWYGQKVAGRSVAPEPKLDIYVVWDETRVLADELLMLLKDMGELGFGRDAGIGLGRFAVDSWEVGDLPGQSHGDAWLTLGPCAPQGLAFDPSRSFYHPFTRFGRHGDMGARLGNPFKSPILMADTGAVFVPRPHAREGLGFTARFIGQGLGGDGSLSKAKGLENTVHQGYAPAVAIRLPGKGGMP